MEKNFVGIYNGMYGDSYKIVAANETLVPKYICGRWGVPEKFAGISKMNFVDFEKWMERCGYKKHHMASYVQHYQSKKYNVVEKYQGRLGEGYRMWVHAPQSRGSAICIYYLLERR